MSVYSVRQHPRRVAAGRTIIGAHTRNRVGRENDTVTARRLKALHDDELWKAFAAMQVLEHEVDKIPAEDLRAPIPGFRDKRWMLEKIRSIRADLDNLRSGMAARVWREK